MRRFLHCFLTFLVCTCHVQASSDDSEDDSGFKLRVLSMTLDKGNEYPDFKREAQVAQLIQDKHPCILKLRGYHTSVMRVLDLIREHGYRSEGHQKSTLSMGVREYTSVVLGLDDLANRGVQLVENVLQFKHVTEQPQLSGKLNIGFENGLLGRFDFSEVEWKHLKIWGEGNHELKRDRETLCCNFILFTGLFDYLANKAVVEEQSKIKCATADVLYEHVPGNSQKLDQQEILLKGWRHDHVFYVGECKRTETRIYPLNSAKDTTHNPIITEFWF